MANTPTVARQEVEKAQAQMMLQKEKLFRVRPDSLGFAGLAIAGLWISSGKEPSGVMMVVAGTLGFLGANALDLELFENTLSKI